MVGDTTCLSSIDSIDILLLLRLSPPYYHVNITIYWSHWRGLFYGFSLLIRSRLTLFSFISFKPCPVKDVSGVKMNIDFETMAVLEEESPNVSPFLSLLLDTYTHKTRWNLLNSSRPPFFYWKSIKQVPEKQGKTILGTKVERLLVPPFVIVVPICFCLFLSAWHTFPRVIRYNVQLTMYLHAR